MKKSPQKGKRSTIYIKISRAQRMEYTKYSVLRHSPPPHFGPKVTRNAMCEAGWVIEGEARSATINPADFVANATEAGVTVPGRPYDGYKKANPASILR